MSAFSDVDSSDRPEGLILYLDWVAGIVGSLKGHLIELLELRRGERVLDVGCGAGHDVVTLAGAGMATIGVDSSRAMVEATRRRVAAAGTDADVVLACGEALPFLDGSFDAARIERVLQHAVDPGAVLHETRRALRPGGRVVVFEPDWSSFAVDSAYPSVVDAVRRSVMRGARHPRIGLQLRRVLLESGFESVRCEMDPAMATTPEAFAAICLLDRVLARAVAERDTTDDEAELLRTEVARRFERGTFWATLNRVIAVAERSS